MSGVFNDLYAENYDLVYQSKNYEREIEGVSRIMTQIRVGRDPHNATAMSCAAQTRKTKQALI
jgi:hypothetical protein